MQPPLQLQLLLPTSMLGQIEAILEEEIVPPTRDAAEGAIELEIKGGDSHSREQDQLRILSLLAQTTTWGYLYHQYKSIKPISAI